MWTIQSVDLSWRDQVSNVIFGHVFTVQILMRYTPGGAGNTAFIESPHLTWKEKIFFNRHKDKSYWHWEGDVFVNRPLASTFHAWRRRYIEAYNTATMAPSERGMINGAVELRDSAGHPIRITHLPGRPQPVTDEEKARFIRNFIQKSGGQLSVEIDDRPAVASTPPEVYSPLTTQGQPKAPQHIAQDVERLKRRDERLLLFECGVGASLATASQYIVIDYYLRANWIRQFARGHLRSSLPVDGGYTIESRPDLYRVETPEHQYGFGGLNRRGEYL
jgi:hypothetical protein